MIRVRRYSPLLLLAIAQLVLALAFPSRAPATASAPPPLAITAPGTGDTGADGTAATTDEGGGPAAGGPRTGTAGGSTATGVSAALPGTVNRGGDTRHCVDGRQFGGGFLIVPPCVPTWGDRDNGGATSQGVTRSSIEVGLYRPILTGIGRPAVTAISAIAPTTTFSAWGANRPIFTYSPRVS